MLLIDFKDFTLRSKLGDEFIGYLNYKKLCETKLLIDKLKWKMESNYFSLKHENKLSLL